MSEDEYEQWGIYAEKHSVTMRDEPAEHLRRLAVIFIKNYRDGINLNNSNRG